VRVSNDRRMGRVVVLIAALWVLSSAAAGTVSDQQVARSLVVHALDARPLFVGYMRSYSEDTSPCLMSRPAGSHGGSMNIGAGIPVTATATGNWGGVTIGLFSVATIASTQAGAGRLYEELVARLPVCLLHVAKTWNDSRQSHPCRSASERSLRYRRYGEATRGWRARYFTPYANGCTARALDGVVVRAGRAVGYYLFDNARLTPDGRDADGTAARDEELVRRVVERTPVVP